MRVVTLLPGATEIVAALGAGALLTGVSHECDHPDWVRTLPRLTSTLLDPSQPSGAIDAAVRRLREAGRAVIQVEAEALARLAPDLVITQDLCEVCAVADGVVHRLADVMPRPPEVLSLTGRTVSGVLEDIRRVAWALDRSAQGDALAAELRARLDRLSPEPAPERRVVCIEWLQPLYLAGHWVPELVAAAGGLDVGARPGVHSARSSWADVAALRPELAVVMPCGFDVPRARRELDELVSTEAAAVLGSIPVWLLDGNAYSSRPGPRIVDGAERIRAAIRGEERPGLERWEPAR
jgi:iron complex transport system substrate-binding protein